jgi:hypothetical protein
MENELKTSHLLKAELFIDEYKKELAKKGFFWNKCDNYKVMEYLRKASEEYNLAGDFNASAGYYLTLINFRNGLDKNDRGIIILIHKYLEICKKANMPFDPIIISYINYIEQQINTDLFQHSIPLIYELIAENYEANGKINDAIKYYNVTLLYVKSQNKDHFQIKILNVLGMIYFKNKNYMDSFASFEECRKICLRTNLMYHNSTKYATCAILALVLSENIDQVPLKIDEYFTNNTNFNGSHAHIYCNDIYDAKINNDLVKINQLTTQHKHMNFEKEMHQIDSMFVEYLQ